MSETSPASSAGLGRPFITSVSPSITFSGVRTSWLIMARKRDLAALA